MNVTQLKIWGFRCFGSADVPGQGDPDPRPVSISLEPNITGLIGRNGAGKSAVLQALQRLFGETREERATRNEDFFVVPGETIESRSQRQLYIEATIEFPELKGGVAKSEKTVPAGFRHMIVEKAGSVPIARIRLEAVWSASGALDGVVDENIYWLLTTADVPFGDVSDPTIKQKMSSADRASVVVRYIPASRDVAALTRLTLRSLGRSLMQSVRWKNETKIKEMIAEASKALDAEAAINSVNAAINDTWQRLNAADTETTARLSVLPPDFQQIVRAASIVLEPSADGRKLGTEELSDGQRSLFHFALVKSLLDLKFQLEAKVQAKEDVPFSIEFTRAPALTIFAFEEPENHLAPYYLARLLGELQTLAASERVQAVFTSHSPAIVGRLDPRSLRHLRRDRKTGISTGSPLDLPPEADEAAKFVREAVRAHPEIYFARHAIFGEGASEEIVLPRIADALRLPVDRSFVAIVPIGGRYIDHFWRLVNQLGIPHTTLLDFDLGRSSGDVRQIKAVANALLKTTKNPDAHVKGNCETALVLERSGKWAEGDGWDRAKLQTWIEFLESQGVFFSTMLDLDMMMLRAFPAAYQKLPDGAYGPQAPGEPARQLEACKRVLGDGGFGPAAYAGSDEMVQFPWYAYLFLGSRGKPAVHLSALAQLDNVALAASCPPALQRLIARVADHLAGTT